MHHAGHALAVAATPPVPWSRQPGPAGPWTTASDARVHAGRPYGVASVGLAIRPGSRDHEADRVAADGDDDEEDPSCRRMRLEAVLLFAKSPLSTRKLAQLAELADATEARTLVRELNRTYDALGRALRIEKVAGGYRIMTRPALAHWLARLGHLPPAVRLSSPMMETLAVVAYREPVSRADVESIRGVSCGELLRQLLERDLIRIAGRGEELGRPYLYGTTKRFLQLFGLSSPHELPRIDRQPLRDDDDARPDHPEADDAFDPASGESPTSTKEPAVSTVVDPVVTRSHAPPTSADAADTAALLESPRGVIEDEEDELYEGGDEDDEEDEIIDDELDEDWDDDEDLDEDDPDDDLDDDEDDDQDEDDDEDDDLAESDWVEVDDEDDDEDWDDEDDEDDEDDWDEEDDDEDWT